MSRRESVEDDPPDYICSPVLRPRPLEEGQHVLLLDERSRLNVAGKYWVIGFYKTIFVEVIRVNGTKKIYKVHLVKNCQVLDLLNAFEEFLEQLSSTNLYLYNVELERETWLGDGINGTSYILMEQGSNRKIGKISQYEGSVRKETKELATHDEILLTPVPDWDADLALSPQSSLEASEHGDPGGDELSLTQILEEIDQVNQEEQVMGMPIGYWRGMEGLLDNVDERSSVSHDLENLSNVSDISFNMFPPLTEEPGTISITTLLEDRPFPLWPQQVLAPDSTSVLLKDIHKEAANPPKKIKMSLGPKNPEKKQQKDIISFFQPLHPIVLVTPKKDLKANGDGNGTNNFDTPSPILIQKRTQGGRRPNWTLEDKKKLLRMAILKMDDPTNRYNKVGRRDIEQNVYTKISRPQNIDDRPADDLIQQYYRTGHPTDQSINGGGMHRFLKDQMEAIGLDFTVDNIRATLEDLLEVYEKLSRQK